MWTIALGNDFTVPVYFADARGIARDLTGPAEWFRWRVMANEGATYSQVYPSSGWVTGDLLLDRVGVGEYVIRFTVDPAWSVGQYLVEFQAHGIRDYQWAVRFEAVSSELPILRAGDHLALLRDLREYGVAPAVPDYRLAQIIVRASRQIERYCGRVFTPRKQTMTLYPEASGRLWFPSPCVWLQSITGPGGDTLDLTSCRFFSRAMRSVQGAPGFGEDDRDTSRIECQGLARGSAYEVTGVFGCTEPDGSEIGQTPEQITWAACATAVSLLAYQTTGGSSSPPVDRIIEEKTATQSYRLSDNPEWAAQVTAGDTEIARVLNSFRRPMQIGLV